ncbi:rotatin [Spea bombifrons]|uniref:rotatin n=1 Tax=Spea bombifrons TaxID=233779 RepID=UPI00234A7ECB|nr:rotatin [Spea bombifrons]
MDLSALVKKLAHHLVEIRERALKNILSKLDHNLLSFVDLVQEKPLFLHLLQWFNFPAVPMKEDVLLLLNKLVKHSSAAQWMIEIGAVDFLTQLRPNVEPNLQALVDGILDGLFLLPTDISNNRLSSSHEVKSLPTYNFAAIQHQADLTDGYFHQDACVLQHSSVSTEQSCVNYSPATCLKYSTFPWLTLTTTDRHVLSSNESTLQSSNQGLIWRSCQLLQDVVMQDFPAEIFLQRPKIVQSLLSLLGLASETDGQQHLAFQSISCLLQLCILLRNRLNFHRDPGFVSTKQEVFSQNSSVLYCQDARRNSQNPSPANEQIRPSVLGRASQRLRGDGQDGDATSSSGNSIQAHTISRTAPWSPLDIGHQDLQQIEREDPLESQFQQLSLAQFCVSLLENAATLLQSDKRKLITRVVELLSESVALLNDAISEHVWEDTSLIGQELRCKLRFSLDTLGEAILYHKNKSGSELTEPSLVNHRMAFISISLFTMRLLQTLLPVEKANDVLPESLMNALFLISLDLPFRIAYPSVHESVTAFMEQLNSEDYGVYKQASEVAYSIECTTTFMSCSSKEGAKDFLELVELAEKALTSLPYHKHFPFVRKFIGICSDIYKSAQSGPVLLEESQKVLLRLLSHWVSAIKAETYTCCLEIVKDSLGIENATKTVSSICHGVRFLLQPNVLYEICTFGLQDSNVEISSTAKSILTFLLQGRLVMTAPTWNKFLDALYPVLSVLQGFADTEDALGSSILSLCETSQNGEGVTPKTTRLRAALRLMFAKKNALRSLAIKWLSIHLMNEEESNVKRPELQGSILSKAVSLYILERPLDLKLDDSGKSIFKAETVTKVAEIFKSEKVDMSLQKSAAEQLAVIAQDLQMHPILKNMGVAEKSVNILQKCVHKDGKVFECIVLPCITLLRKMIYADPVLRLSLAQDPCFLLALFRVTLFLQEDSSLLIEAAALLSLLLFDEISQLSAWSETVSGPTPPPFGLPVTVVRRFHLPVSVSTHHAVSPYTMASPLSLEWLTITSVADMLRMAWNLSWYQGVDNLLSKMASDQQEKESFLDTLKLSPEEVLTLKMTHSASGLQDCLNAIIRAVSHREVRSAVARMNFYLLNDRLVLNCLTGSNMSSLKCLPWHTALSRFLLVYPACAEDEKLLADVISFLNKILREQRGSSDSQDLQWMLEMLLKQSPSPLLDLIVQKECLAKKDLDDTQAAVRQHLQKELMVFFNTLMLCLTSVTDRKCLALAGSLRTQLTLHLLQSLKVSDVPNFYGLPSLSRTLRGMAHVTSLSGWSLYCPSTEPFTVCTKLLTSLLEIISSFYVEWGGNALSYMGKGVTKSTVLCLLHLSHEMTVQAKNTDWVHLWSLPYDHGNEEHVIPRLGLEWLIPLWVDRDPEVRFTSLGIGSALTSLKEGALVLSESCQNISGGLWGTVLSIFLDQCECSMVRREAAFILQNMLVIPMPANPEDSNEYTLQGPCVYDDESGLSTVGKTAVQVLLDRYHFYDHVSQMVKSCYLGRYTYDFSQSVVEPKAITANITSSEDSLYIWHNAENNSSPTPESDSTISTWLPSTSSTSSTGHLHPVSASSLCENISDPLLDKDQSHKAGTVSLSSEENSASVGMPDQCSVVTPSHLSAICGLLENLLIMNPGHTAAALSERRILTDLSSLIKPTLLERCFSDFKSPLIFQFHTEVIKSQVMVLLEYLSALSRLIQTCLILDVNLVIKDELIQPLLTIMFSLLSVQHKKARDVEISSAIYQTWTDIFICLTTLLRKHIQTVTQVATVFTKQGTSLLGTVSECLRLATSHPKLYTASMHFLSVLLAEHGKLQCLALDSPCTSELCALLDGNVNMGYDLCKVILQSYEEKSSEDPLRQVCASTLILLLAVSRSAQKYSLQAHLVDSCIEQMKHIHAQLNLDSLRPGKPAQRKKEESHLKNLKAAMYLLRNSLYQNKDGKAAALDTQLAPLLHSLWPWLLMDDALMQNALHLLCVYTANYPAACSSVCWTNAGVMPVQLSQKAPANNSLMHSLLKIASEPASSNSSTQQAAFVLLSNLAATQDCKCLIQKSNFLQHFLSVSLPKGGAKALNMLAVHWLKFLWNLSLATDGQQMIMKLKGSLDLLLELIKYNNKSDPPIALLILHNICFNTASKPKILSNDKAVAVISSCLESEDTSMQRIGASALWALLHNYQKAKVILKNPLLKGRIEEMLSTLRKNAMLTDDMPVLYHLKCLENLEQILNN